MYVYNRKTLIWNYSVTTNTSTANFISLHTDIITNILQFIDNRRHYTIYVSWNRLVSFSVIFY